MKRSWAGLGILLVLLGAAVAVTGFMSRSHEEISLALEQSARCAGEGDWDSADLFFTAARQDWERWERLRACFADHTPTEEIDADLAALEIYARARDPVAFCAACSALARQVAAVGEAHEPVWWNLF